MTDDLSQGGVSPDRPINIDNPGRGWQVDGRFARHRCRVCGCETEPGGLFVSAGHIGSVESWPVCPRGGCGSVEVDLIVSYNGPREGPMTELSKAQGGPMSDSPDLLPGEAELREDREVSVERDHNAWRPGDPCANCGSRRTVWVDDVTGAHCLNCGSYDDDE